MGFFEGRGGGRPARAGGLVPGKRASAGNRAGRVATPGHGTSSATAATVCHLSTNLKAAGNLTLW